MNYLIGIDVGTSATKTVLFDENGQIKGSVSCEYPLYQPENGWAEQKAEDWRDAVLKTLKEVMKLSGVPAEEVIQLYQQTKGAKFRTPRFDLKDFMRIRINPGEESQYSFHIPASRFSDFNMEGHRMLVPGTHKLFVSTSLPIARSLELGTTPWLEGEITVK